MQTSMQLLRKSHLREVDISEYKDEEVTTFQPASNVSVSLKQNKTEVLKTFDQSALSPA